MSVGSILVLCLVPILIVALNRVERNFGPARAGWVSSFPIVGAPALLIVTLQHGNAFGSRAARSALLGAAGWAGFLLCYRFAPRLRARWISPVPVVAISVLVWAGLDWTLVSLSLPTIWPAFILAGLVAICFSLGSTKGAKSSGAKWILPMRVLLATIFTITVVIASYVGGERISGLLTTFPIVSSSLMLPIFFKRRYEQTVAMVSGMLMAGPALASFMLLVSYFLASKVEVFAAYGLALCAAGLVHVSIWTILSKHGNSSSLSHSDLHRADPPSRNV